MAEPDWGPKDRDRWADGLLIFVVLLRMIVFLVLALLKMFLMDYVFFRWGLKNANPSSGVANFG